MLPVCLVLPTSKKHAIVFILLCSLRPMSCTPRTQTAENVIKRLLPLTESRVSGFLLVWRSAPYLFVIPGGTSLKIDVAPRGPRD